MVTMQQQSIEPKEAARRAEYDRTLTTKILTVDGTLGHDHVTGFEVF